MALFSQHKILVIVGGMVLALAAWYSLAPSSTTDVLSSESAAGTGPGKEVVDTLRQLDAVKLDAAVLSDPAFSALRDFSTQIIPEPVGRPNPFAPLTAGPDTSASSAKAANIFAPTPGR